MSHFSMNPKRVSDLPLRGSKSWSYNTRFYERPFGFHRIPRTFWDTGVLQKALKFHNVQTGVILDLKSFKEEIFPILSPNEKHAVQIFWHSVSFYKILDDSRFQIKEDELP